jgi:RNA polymerase-binding transcription factor DksA
MTRRQELEILESVLLEKLDQVNNALASDVAIMGPDQIRELAAAAEQVVRGAYGQCVDCNASIPLRRLRVKPEAVRCIACQQRAEQMRMQPEYVRYAS